MSYATAAPGQQAGTVGSAPPTCHNCNTSTTPLWRRDESGAVLCNACGLFLKLHGRSRPSSLKTDVIKSRNRVKTTLGNQVKPSKKTSPNGASHGFAASHPSLSLPQAASGSQRDSLSHARLSDNLLNIDDSFERSGSPSNYRSSQREQHPPNIAPQHLFDGATFEAASPQNASNGYLNHSPYAPRQNGSRSSLSPINVNINVNGTNGRISGSNNDESNSDLRTLLGSNTSLKTRVSELEVINELFRGRVNELESSEAEAQRQLDDALRREQEFRSKIAALEALLAASDAESEERASKRMKFEHRDGQLEPVEASVQSAPNNVPTEPT